ncbi:hypothetical protein Mapa_003032 [Marchantia paleacea]|nr:hypothetical protein Mapa_003032 [Marchantia paleacea]
MASWFIIHLWALMQFTSGAHQQQSTFIQTLSKDEHVCKDSLVTMEFSRHVLDESILFFCAISQHQGTEPSAPNLIVS